MSQTIQTIQRLPRKKKILYGGGAAAIVVGAIVVISLLVVNFAPVKSRFVLYQFPFNEGPGWTSDSWSSKLSATQIPDVYGVMATNNNQFYDLYGVGANESVIAKDLGLAKVSDLYCNNGTSRCFIANITETFPGAGNATFSLGYDVLAKFTGLGWLIGFVTMPLSQIKDNVRRSAT